MADLNDTRGAEPASNTPVSYDTQLELDVRSAFETTENAPAPADNGGKRQYTRDEAGRFAEKDGDKTDEKAEAPVEEPTDEPKSEEPDKPADAPPVEEPEETPAAPPAAPAGSPPPGWSVTSKAAWEQLPEHIRADVIKREGEVAQGLAALREYKDIKPYAEQARQSGTTLAAALQRYTTMEGSLRRDPANGLMAVAQNVGLSKAQAAELFADLAQKLGAKPTQQPQTPNQTGGAAAAQVPNGSHQDDPLRAVIDPLIEQRLGSILDQRLDPLLTQRIGPMSEKIGLFEDYVNRQREADQNAKAQQVAADREYIYKMAADPKYRYFPDLEGTIRNLLMAGLVPDTGDLAAQFAAAYDMAARLHPEVSEVLINERLKTKTEETKAKEQQVAARAQAASRSITGSASSGTDAAPKGKRKGLSYEADLDADARAAWDAVAGRA